MRQVFNFIKILVLFIIITVAATIPADAQSAVSANPLIRGTVTIKPEPYSPPNDRFTTGTYSVGADTLVLLWLSMDRNEDLNAAVSLITGDGRAWTRAYYLSGGAKGMYLYVSRQAEVSTNIQTTVQLVGSVANSTRYSYNIVEYTASAIGNIDFAHQNNNETSDSVLLPSATQSGSAIAVGFFVPKKPDKILTAGLTDPTSFVFTGYDTFDDPVEVRLATEFSPVYENPAGARWSVGGRSDMIAVELLPVGEPDPNNLPPTADAQSLIVMEDTASSIALTGSDPESMPLSYTVITLPVNGVLTGIAPDLIYMPATNYSGADSFAFRVSDGVNTSLPATVSITVNPVNDMPTANVQSVTTIENTAKSITLTGSDPDGDPLTFSYTEPIHGVLTGTAPNLTYTPDLGYVGDDSFDFTVSDDGGVTNSASATVSITVSVTPPTQSVDAVGLTSGQLRNILSAQTASFTAPADRLLLMWIVQSLSPSAAPPTVSDPSRTWTLVESRHLSETGISLWQSKSDVETTGAVTISYPTSNSFIWSIVGYGAEGVIQHNGVVSPEKTFVGQVSLPLAGIPNSAVAAGFGMRRDILPLTPGEGYTFTDDPPTTGVRMQTEFRPDFSPIADMSWAISTPWIGIAVEIR